MTGPCPACSAVSAARRGEHPALLAEFDETVALLAEHQTYEGWCVLFLKDHEEHLAALDVDRQARIFREVARVGKAVQSEFAPRRINYECLGNLLHHIHWHVIPRHAWDPDPRNTVWVRPAAERESGCDPARRDALVGRLRRALGRF